MILVDDVSLDADVWIDALKGLRSEGAGVKFAFTLVERKEGDVREALNQEGVTFVSGVTLSDDDLSALAIQHITNGRVASPVKINLSH
jgi:orotate phosphoribosyltransferase